jgi:hypothetical protein
LGMNFMCVVSVKLGVGACRLGQVQGVLVICLTIVKHKSSYLP